jgi:hypothetical protein
MQLTLELTLQSRRCGLLVRPLSSARIFYSPTVIGSSGGKRGPNNATPHDPSAAKTTTVTNSRGFESSLQASENLLWICFLFVREAANLCSTL